MPKKKTSNPTEPMVLETELLIDEDLDTILEEEENDPDASKKEGVRNTLLLEDAEFDIVDFDDEKFPDDKLSSNRPWTASCIDNLYNNIKAIWLAEQTANETNRNVENVIAMTHILKRHGFEKIYSSYVEKERTGEISHIQYISDEMQEEIVSMDVYECRNCGVSVKLDEEKDNIRCEKCNKEFLKREEMKKLLKDKKKSRKG